MPFFYQPNCDTLDSLTSFASIHINILPVYMYFWLGQWYAIRNKYPIHVLLFETLLNEWDWYFCNPTLHGLAAYTCGYGDEIQTRALVTIFLVVNGVVYEHVSSPIVLIAECLWSLKSCLSKCC